MSRSSESWLDLRLPCSFNKCHWILHVSLLASPDETEAPQAAGDGMELEEPSKEATEESAVSTEPQLPSEFEKLFKGCEDNPEDFNGWVYLLQYVEQEVGEGMQIIQICDLRSSTERRPISIFDFIEAMDNWMTILKEKC